VDDFSPKHLSLIRDHVIDLLPVVMGHMYSAYLTSPDTTPKYEEDPTFDPNYGFPHGRKERKMIATVEEMESASLSADQRDYCAHVLIDLFKCRQQKFPWVVACKHQKHLYEECQHNDWVLRMKEYERERRLLERQKRKRIAEGGGDVIIE